MRLHARLQHIFKTSTKGNAEVESKSFSPQAVHFARKQLHTAMLVSLSWALNNNQLVCGVLRRYIESESRRMR